MIIFCFMFWIFLKFTNILRIYWHFTEFPFGAFVAKSSNKIHTLQCPPWSSLLEIHHHLLLIHGNEYDNVFVSPLLTIFFSNKDSWSDQQCFVKYPYFSIQFRLNRVLRSVIMSAKSYEPFISGKCFPSKVSEVSIETSMSLHFSLGASFKAFFSYSGTATSSFS